MYRSTPILEIFQNNSENFSKKFEKFKILENNI